MSSNILQCLSVDQVPVLFRRAVDILEDGQLGLQASTDTEAMCNEIAALLALLIGDHVRCALPAGVSLRQRLLRHGASFPAADQVMQQIGCHTRRLRRLAAATSEFLHVQRRLVDIEWRLAVVVASRLEPALRVQRTQVILQLELSGDVNRRYTSDHRLTSQVYLDISPSDLVHILSELEMALQR